MSEYTTTGGKLVAALAAAVMVAHVDPNVTIGIAGGRKAAEHLARINAAADALLAHHAAQEGVESRGTGTGREQ